MSNEILSRILDKCEAAGNLAVFDSFVKAYPKIETKRKILCFISGGADSDIVLDIFAKLDQHKKVKYIFFDTGIEYQATKEHLDFLEQKYGITIERIKAVVPVPLGCKKHGVPFWSKHASEMIERLQSHGFKWEDKPFDELIKEYPKCRAALRWWCNDFAEKIGKNGKIIKSKFNINYIDFLKEYMIANPPPFKISPKCCEGAKKKNAKKYLDLYEADLNVLGLRKDEGGIRSVAFKTCFTPAKNNESWDNYRPIFFYTDKDKTEYEELFCVTHSKCYSVYGLRRTGCAGCPFGKDFENELQVIKEHEPRLYNAVNKIFGESYEYTRKFYEFRKSMKEGETIV